MSVHLNLEPAFSDQLGINYIWQKIAAAFKPKQAVVTGATSTSEVPTDTVVDHIVQDKNGVISYTKRKIVTDTAGASNTTSKIYLVGATGQTDTAKTYSNDRVYVTNGNLHSENMTVDGGITKTGSTSTTEVFNVSGGTVDIDKFPYICSDTITDTPDGFVYRQTNNGIEKNKENATITRYVGNSLVWNQLVQNGDFSDGDSGWYHGSSNTEIENNSIKISPNTSYAVSAISTYIGYVPNHKYYFSCYTYLPSIDFDAECRFGFGANSSGYGNTNSGANSTKWLTVNRVLEKWVKNETIFTSGDFDYGSSISEFQYMTLRFYNAANQSVPSYIKAKNFKLIDLTLMFGAGKEPSTAAEFEKLLTEPYYPYNAGTLINNRTQAIESVGFNLWDEEWEQGTIDENGDNQATSAGVIRSKNYIHIFGGKTYRYQGGNAVVYCYDSAKKLIPYTGTSAYHNGIDVTDRTFDLPNNTAYIRFRTSSSYGTVYNNDICINLSDTSRNGTYEPYKKYDLPINLNSFRVKDSNGNIITIEGGLKSAGSVYDEITSDGKYIKRVGDVDLGSLSWTYDSTHLRMITSANSERKGKDGYDIANILCQKFVSDSIENVYSNVNSNTISMVSNGAVWIFQSEYTDATAFKTAMSGIQLYYELATPEVYDLVEVIPNNYPVDDLGTEARIAPLIDGVPGSPFKGDIDYYRSSDSYLHTVTVNGFPAHVNNGTAEIELPLEDLSGHIYDAEKDSLAEGVNESKGTINVASGIRSHAEGIGTVAGGTGAHAEGLFNDPEEGALHTIGIGMSDNDRKNAVMVTNVGDAYVRGIGYYDGTNSAMHGITGIAGVSGITGVAGATGVYNLQDLLGHMDEAELMEPVPNKIIQMLFYDNIQFTDLYPVSGVTSIQIVDFETNRIHFEDIFLNQE